jgi:hypothetical protein
MGSEDEPYWREDYRLELYDFQYYSAIFLVTY